MILLFCNLYFDFFKPYSLTCCILTIPLLPTYVLFQFSSVAQSCLTLRPLDCSTPGFPDISNYHVLIATLNSYIPSHWWQKKKIHWHRKYLGFPRW